jgi:sortase A
VTDTTTTTPLAKLTPASETASDAPAPESAPPAPKADDPKPAASRARPIPIGAVARRGIQVFAVVAIAFLVFGLWLSGLAHARSQIGLQRRFRSELASNSADVGGAIPNGAPVANIDINSFGIHEVAVQGSRSGQLRAGPGHVIGTPLPGQAGNAVIAGRRSLYGGPFSRLGSLKRGDLIHVTTGEGNTTYRVTTLADLPAGDGSFVQDHGDNRLTLFTTDSRWSADGRLVVSATLIGNPFPSTTLSRTLDADGLGLTGERDAVPYMLVWLELLAAAGFLAAFAATRWSAARTWLVFAPIIAFTLWLFFESVVRLLPATL